MKEHVKKKWLEALRSGKYKQGDGCLRNGDSFCCLGVLCDLHKKTTKKSGCVWEERGGDSYLYFHKENFLPEIVQEWAGLIEEDPRVGNYRLSDLNDNKVSFDKLADMIEEEL